MFSDGKVIEYMHDPFGRRIAKKVDGVIVEKYLWQGPTRLLAVYDGTDNLIMRFEYADGRMPVSMTRGGSTYYLTYDQVGSLRVVADSSGNVVKGIDYDSFGNIISDSDPTFKIPFGFAGGLHDRDTDLVRFGFRDYDPDIGRWTAKDPIGFWGGDTDLYGYCLNDPISLVDPWGLVEPAVPGFVDVRGIGPEYPHPKPIPPAPIEEIGRAYPKGKAIPGQWVTLGFESIIFAGYVGGRLAWQGLIAPLRRIIVHRGPFGPIILGPVMEKYISPPPVEAAPAPCP